MRLGDSSLVSGGKAGKAGLSSTYLGHKQEDSSLQHLKNQIKTLTRKYKFIKSTLLYLQEVANPGGIVFTTHEWARVVPPTLLQVQGQAKSKQKP